MGSAVPCSLLSRLKLQLGEPHPENFQLGTIAQHSLFLFVTAQSSYVQEDPQRLSYSFPPPAFSCQEQQEREMAGMLGLSPGSWSRVCAPSESILWCGLRIYPLGISAPGLLEAKSPIEVLSKIIYLNLNAAHLGGVANHIFQGLIIKMGQCVYRSGHYSFVLRKHMYHTFVLVFCCGETP